MALMDLDAVREIGNLVTGRVVIDATLPGDPFPARRPRFDSRSNRAYNVKEYDEALETVAWQLTAARPRRADEGQLSVDLTFYRANRLDCDLDNLVKTVLDAAKRVLWSDDKQVAELRARKVLGVGRARACTKIRVRRI